MNDQKKEESVRLGSHEGGCAGRRCCGRPLSEKCSPEEEAVKIDPKTGEKSCCKGQHAR